MAHATKGALRSMKNVAKGYSELQIKVREATSNDPWGPSTELMHQIASQTHSGMELSEVIQILSKRLNDHGRNWRHVLKALIVLDYLIHCGSEQIVEYARENLYLVKTLKEFQYVHDGVDCGANVRQKAKELAELLMDDDRIQRERKDRSQGVNRMMSERYSGDNGMYRSTSYDTNRDSSSSSSSSSDLDQYEEDVRKAIRESLKTIEEDKQRQMHKNKYSVPDLSEEEQLQRAIALSKKEEEERQIRLYGGRLNSDLNAPYASSSGSSSSASKRTDKDLIDLLTGQEHPIQAPHPQPTIFDPFGVAAPTHHPFHVSIGYPPPSLPSQPYQQPLQHQQPQQQYPHMQLPQGNFFLPKQSSNLPQLPPSQPALALPPPQPVLALPPPQPVLALPPPQPVLALPPPPSSSYTSTQPSDFNPFGPSSQDLLRHPNPNPTPAIPLFSSENKPSSDQLLSFPTSTSQFSLPTAPSSTHSVTPSLSSNMIPSHMVNLDQLTANNPFLSQTPPATTSMAFQTRNAQTQPQSQLSLNQLAQQPFPAYSSSTSSSIQMLSTYTSNNGPTVNNSVTATSSASNLFSTAPPSQPSQAKTNPFLL